ncbi:RING-H2 finger protein ATL72 [Ananas comosus]|uniref:RING-H2 finger protein ATL72 n=1 Tax=Ananas comosus TaxID=4615 RepID=A0A199V0C5_ANACO|nr:RING-H2 finger protein ATL72 [Ananas comosus]
MGLLGSSSKGAVRAREERTHQVRAPGRGPGSAGGGGERERATRRRRGGGRELRHEHGDHPRGAAVRADIRAGAQLDRAVRAPVRAAPRRGGRLGGGRRLGVVGGRAAAGLKPRALRRIPVEVYGRGGCGAGSGAGAGAAEGAECAICLGEFAEGEKVRVLPTCRHGFHVRCIDTWLAAHSSCPTCRSSLLRIDCGGAGAGAGAAGAEGR